MSNTERIRWASRVSQAKIWQLYQSDARGILDEELIDEVGIALYARAQSILLVINGDVCCPRCRSIVHIGWEQTQAPDEVILCPTAGCFWQTTYRDWRKSLHRQHLLGRNANSALKAFVEQYRRARRPQNKMLLIDQLIHAFHQKLKERDPLKSVASNLIEGKGPKVVAFLDRLAYGDGSTSGLKETRAAWRERLEADQAHRSST
jgi:hypothetical protein